MIRKLKFSNFYSFKKQQEIDFTATKKKSYSYFTSKSEGQITKIAGFIGANAAGKTNVMRVLGFLYYFARIGNKEKSSNSSNTNSAFKTFFNNSLPSNFYIEFERNDTIFYYEFTIKKNKIIKEILSIKKISKYSKKIVIFQRDENKNIDINKKYLKGFKNAFLSNIRNDVSLIAFLKSHYDIEVINHTYDYFANFKGNFNENGDINSPHHQIEAINIYFENPKLKEEIDRFVYNFDLGLKGFNVEKKKKGDETLITINGVHLNDGEINELNFAYESRGTRSLFFTLPNIFYALKNGGVVIIDEIESGLHPEALDKLISYFIDECENSKTQLIFSSNSLGFLNILDMHQIYLADKNDNGESFVYRLNQIKKIRSDENFLSKYMTGAYGAFPKIRV